MPRMRNRIALGVFVALLQIVAWCRAESFTVDLGGGVVIEGVKIEPGTFTQGSPPSEAGRNDDETPREVKLSQAFYRGTTPITRGQWDRFVSETHFRTEAERGTSGGYGWDGAKLTQRKEFTWRNPGFNQGADHPVCLITYADANAFCKWLSSKIGKNVTLPTEAQWEYACRAGTTSAWHNGASDIEGGSEVAWSKQNAGNSTRPAAGRKANAWGLYIGGNVWEWCRDWYGPYVAGPVVDPIQENPNVGGDKPRRVLRGGSWNQDAKRTRSASRFRSDPGSRNADIGFRVVWTDRPAPPARTEAVPPPSPPAEVNPEPTPSQSYRSPVMPTPVQTRSRWTIGPFVCVLVALAIVVFIAVRVLRGLARPAWNAGTMLKPGFPVDGPARPPQGAVSSAGIRIAPDGFWMMLDDVALGSRVHYGFRLPGAGEEASGSVLYQPGPQGQFVYTGAAPQYARITQVDAPGADAVWDQGTSGVGSTLGGFPPPMPGMTHRPSTTRSTHDDTPRYPSAY
jgi:formylglycine-generating enzyme required for sulfatase activity